MDFVTLKDQVYTFTGNITGGLEWPDVRSIVENYRDIQSERSRPALTLLPILTCVATGGEASKAIPLAASWLLYRIAARILDHIVDQDNRDAPWAHWSMERALNVGLCLTFAAQLCLSRLEVSGATRRRVDEAIAQALMLVSQGQANPPLEASLEQYFEYILLKTGVAYATFARAGVQIHSRDKILLQATYDYGYALGMSFQIKNDLADILSPTAEMRDAAMGIQTLPYILARYSCVEHHEYRCLVKLLHERPEWTETDRNAIRRILIDMGVIAQCSVITREYMDKGRTALNVLPSDQTATLMTLFD